MTGNTGARLSPLSQHRPHQAILGSLDGRCVCSGRSGLRPRQRRVPNDQEDDHTPTKPLPHAFLQSNCPIVVAGAGARVAKHGNRAASSACGSADVLEALGVTLELGPDGVARCIEEAGIGFCFAPAFHPALRFAGPARRELGVPTTFNFLGPLANPARVRRQMVGVSDPAMAELLIEVLGELGASRAWVVYGDDGLDELTTTTTSHVLELHEGAVRRFVVDPVAHGLSLARPGDLLGGDAARNADIAREVFGGGVGPVRDIVVLNAAAALVVAGYAEDLDEGIAKATASLDGGHARSALATLVEVSAREAEQSGAAK